MRSGSVTVAALHRGSRGFLPQGRLTWSQVSTVGWLTVIDGTRLLASGLSLPRNFANWSKWPSLSYLIRMSDCATDDQLEVLPAHSVV